LLLALLLLFLPIEDHSGAPGLSGVGIDLVVVAVLMFV